MDVLVGISLDSFKVLTWVIALSVGVLWFFIAAHKKYWEIISASLLGLVVAASTFLFANFGVAAYILSHVTDPRWSAGKSPLWTPNKLESNLPFINDIVTMLNGVQENVSGAVNNVGAIQNAFFAAGDFLWMVVLAIPTIIVLAIAAFIASRWAKRQNDKQQTREITSLKLAVEENAANLADIRRQKGLPPFPNLEK
jgi:hypothetical protein